jgi:MFS family permease
MVSALNPFGPQVTLAPSATGLPGTDVLQGLTDGLGYWALLAALIGILLGAAMWGLGHYSQNYHQAHNGKKGVLVSGAAALVIGAAPALITFFANQGSRVH